MADNGLQVYGPRKHDILQPIWKLNNILFNIQFESV